MAPPRDIRRRALQALYQLDLRGEDDAASIRAAIGEETTLTPNECDRAFDLALGAYHDRAAADDEFRDLAPEWPTHRRPAIDRAILRLAHYEMTAGDAPPKVVVNDAVELAKEFSTERSPAFINALLDKVLKRVLGVERQEAEHRAEPLPDAAAPPGAS